MRSFLCDVHTQCVGLLPLSSCVHPDLGLVDCLEVEYQIGWPLNTVLSTRSMLAYNIIFRYILKHKALSRRLVDLWTFFKSLQVCNGPLVLLLWLAWSFSILIPLRVLINRLSCTGAMNGDSHPVL